VVRGGAVVRLAHLNARRTTTAPFRGWCGGAAVRGECNTIELCQQTGDEGANQESAETVATDRARGKPDAAPGSGAPILQTHEVNGSVVGSFPTDAPTAGQSAELLTAVFETGSPAHVSHMSMGRQTVRTSKARETFLETLASSCNITAACRAANVSRATAYRWREEDESFDAAWRFALDEAVDELEREAWRRAKDGVDRPITYQGQVTGYFREYSDRLMEVLLKAHRPEKYIERVRSENLHAVAIHIQGPSADL
jgi:hypothetical protein